MNSKQRGFIQIPLLIPILVGVLIIGVGGYILGVKQNQNNLIGDYGQSQVTIENIDKTSDVQSGSLNATENDLISPKVGKTTSPQETPPTIQNPKPASAIRYINKTTYTNIKTGENSFKSTGETLYKGTRVTLISEDEPFSEIEVDNQRFWVFSSSLVVSEPSTTKLSDIIKKWRPVVAYVECDFRDINTNQLYAQSRGSGVAADLEGINVIDILTNRHVIVDDNDYQPHSCRIKLPNSSNTYISQKFTGGAPLDIALITIGNADAYLKNLTNISNSPLSFCRQKPALGDEVVILGYPVIGSQTDITVTEGIISGYDGNYFITSAKVEEGNSGGAAILVNGDCYLGIPSFAKSGSVESLSRILDINAAF